MTNRLSLCYAAPGHALLSTAGPTRNILSLTEALSQWADVTVAFRSCREPIATDKFRVITIAPPAANAKQAQDDVTIRGFNPLPQLLYLRTFRGFARQWANSFDVILEKSWRLSGLLLAAFRRHGVPGALVENDIHFWHEPLMNVRTLARYGLHRIAQGVAGFSSRHTPVIIAETEELKTLLVQQRGIAPERLQVVGLGVDHTLFCPREQEQARTLLKSSSEAYVLLYVGGMDMYHDLGPVIDAFARMQVPALELHIVGDGQYRAHYEAQARQAHMPVRFHGQIPHHMVPEFIAAADICLAPYCVNAFPNGLVPFSTLKIPEYMACGRPVISVPNGHIRRLVVDQVSGFLFPNDVTAWLTFLRSLPSRAQLEDMGRAAAQAVASMSWERTAAQYLDVCQKLAASR